MKIFLFFVAAICWILSLTIDLLSLAKIDVRDEFPSSMWVLHIIMILVGFFTIRYQNENPELQRRKRFGLTSREYREIIFRQTPKWLVIVLKVIFVYSTLSFFLSMYISDFGSPSIIDGQYVLDNHGSIIKVLTEYEYHCYRANELRIFSGTWLAFFTYSLAILYPLVKKELTHKDLSI